MNFSTLTDAQLIEARSNIDEILASRRKARKIAEFAEQLKSTYDYISKLDTLRGLQHTYRYLGLSLSDALKAWKMAYGDMQEPLPPPPPQPDGWDEELYQEEYDQMCKATTETCPGCGSNPGDGINPSCDNPIGCGLLRSMALDLEEELDNLS